MVIFISENVRQQYIGILLSDQSDTDTSHWIGDGNPGCHQRQTSTANASHRRRTVALENVTDETNRVREIIWIGQNWLERSFGEHAVTNFATTWSANRATFPD